MIMRLSSTQRYIVFLLCAACSSFALAADDSASAPDNTRINTRDQDNRTLTPQDQPNRQTDVQVAANVRKALIADHSLSTNAQNVKIVAQDGLVTLRGPVNSAAEMAKVETLAAGANGVTQVRSELDIKNR
jgi:hyperosmotically inducible protein